MIQRLSHASFQYSVTLTGRLRSIDLSWPSPFTPWPRAVLAESGEAALDGGRRALRRRHVRTAIGRLDDIRSRYLHGQPSPLCVFISGALMLFQIG
jgi:hypothetical protein